MIGKVNVIPNGVDLDVFAYKPKKPTKEKVLLFVGDFSYFPNVDAIYYFHAEVLRKLPGVKLKVIGKHVDTLSIFDENVETIEFVHDIHAAYTSADVFVMPVKIGGGTNLKVLEAMASGTPIVGFPPRMAAMEAEPCVHYLPADSPASFKGAIDLLLHNQQLRTTIAKNARSLIEEKYDWKTIGENLHDVWEDM